MKHERILVVAFTLLLLSTITAALFLLQRNVVMEQYSDRMGLMQEAQQLETKMDEDLQRVLTLQLLHYDSLVAITRQLKQKVEVLASSEDGLRGMVKDEEFDKALNAYQDAVAGKIRILEKIKSEVALLRNSLQYLPNILGELSLSDNRKQVELGSSLLSALMEYNLFPGDENYRHMVKQIEELKLVLWQDEQQDNLNHLLLHLNNNLQLREQIMQQVAAYHAQPSISWLARIQGTFQSNHQRISERFYYTSMLLFGVVISLFAGLGIVMRSLQKARSAAVQVWQQMHDALESISEPFVLFDADDKLVLWNRKYAELYQNSTEMLEVGTSFNDLAQSRILKGEYPADELEHLQHTQLLAHHRNVDAPAEETLADGRHYLVSNSRTSVGGTASVYIDITERKLTEEQLRIAAAVFDTTNEGILVTDRNNLIIAVNPSFTRITGYHLEEVVGQTPGILASGRQDKDFYHEMWDTLYATGTWEGEIWNRNKAGTVYPEWLTLTVVRNEAGDVIEHIAVFRDISRRKQDEEKIRWQANYDTITGLPNRTLFLERLSASISSSHREGWITALLFIDLDHFKTVNDTRGHAAGDWLLQEVAGRLAACIREADTVARLGGDEFTVILQDVGSAGDAAKVAKTIVSTISEPFFADGGDIYIGASVGITLYPNDGEDSQTLIRNADLAMYRTKEAGRNGFRFFTQSMNEKLQARTRLEDSMRYAMVRDEFYLVFQPIVDCRNGKTVRAETLIRWQHPERGNVSPSEFIPVAEQSGQIASIGWWMLEQSCRACVDWQQRGFDAGISVNVSAMQIRLGLNVDDIVSMLDDIGLPPQKLTLEITESLLLEETEKVLAWLNRVRAAGIKLSVDDFGTGFSSLSYLKRFPVTSLKIDHSFVRDVTSDKEDAELTRAIITLADTFELEVVAEGVEESEQLAFLKQHGCHLIQGYYFSRPLKQDAMLEYLSRPKESNITYLT